MIINVPNVCGPWQGGPLYHKFAFFFLPNLCLHSKVFLYLEYVLLSNESHPSKLDICHLVWHKTTCRCRWWILGLLRNSSVSLNSGTMVLPLPLILKFILRNTILQCAWPFIMYHWCTSPSLFILRNIENKKVKFYE